MHKTTFWLNLLRKNVEESEIQRRIEQFKVAQMHCDLIKENNYDALVKNCFVIENQEILCSGDEVRANRYKCEQQECFDDWFNACKEGDVEFISRCVNDFQGALD